MIKRVFSTAIVCLTAAAWPWTPAMATNVEPYSIVVKDPNGLIIGNGGLSFDSDQEVAGADQELAPQAAPGPSITLTTGLPPTWLPFTFNTVDPTNPMRVVVVTSALCKPGDRGSNPAVTEKLDQGPNVEGLKYRLTGTKTVGAATRTYALDFDLAKTAVACPGDPTKVVYAYTRTYSLKRIFSPGNESVVATGRYHIWNPKSASPIPEPGSLALLLAGAAAAGLALRGRRGRASASR